MKPSLKKTILIVLMAAVTITAAILAYESIANSDDAPDCTPIPGVAISQECEQVENSSDLDEPDTKADFENNCDSPDGCEVL